MRHIIFKEADQYEVAVLIKESAFKHQEIRGNYVEPLTLLGIPESTIIAFTLQYDTDNKASATFIKTYLASLLPGLNDLGVKYLYVTDAQYFKVLTGQARAEPHLGYVLPCKIKHFEHLYIVLGLNYQALIYNPALQAKLNLSLNALAGSFAGCYAAIGSDILHSASYPTTEQDIEQALEALHRHPRLTCDIETFSLRHDSAHIGTIAFAWDQHNGIAFACDYQINTSIEGTHLHGYFRRNDTVRRLLRQFFDRYDGELIFHNAGFDVKVLIASLWMRDLLDTEQLLQGLQTMTRRFHDTKIIAYLATNTTAGNELGLKTLAHEYAGNWAVEVKDIRRVPLDKLLQYNLIDALSTFYVFQKYVPIMVQDNQQALYESLMLPTQQLLIQMELTGMPLDKDRVRQVKAELQALESLHLDRIVNSPLIQMFNLLLRTSAMEKANAKLKTKQHGLDKFGDVAFNPNSGPQLQRLLYEQMGLPVLDYTDTKQPATGADTLEKLLNHTDVPQYRELLDSLISYGKVSKILSTFIPAFEEGIYKQGELWLHGSFIIGGTVSGRLSSKDPNLQNLPANSTYGKLIKSCFVAPDGWIFAGADFNSLEDYISALTTKDPNKLAVYERGFDGHSLRAAYYFRDQCPEIDLDSPQSVNTIKKKYPDLRQKSKGPTFALTYQGTWHTLVHNLGFTEEQAKAIEAGYHDLYKVSDEYVQERLKQAAKDGYVEVAFGLRIRTPLLKQVMYGAKGMPFAAAAEGRTAGNALGQSYGLLNNRAAVDFMQKVWQSKYRLDIKPVALIHDAIYILIRDDVAVVDWANRELIKSMQWQELPEIQHPTVKLGAALDLFWPSWAQATTLPNDADQQTILKLCRETRDCLKQAA
jgi:DNA polymerase-1